MWILPSRGRPHNIARLLRAYQDTEATTPVLLRLDDDDGGYDVSHKNWIVEVGPRQSLSCIYNDAYRRHQSSWYGFIADDVVPETPHWDARLIEAAGHDGMAVPSGGHEEGGTPHFVLGAALVESMAWLCLPGLKRLYIDTVWADIARVCGVLRRVPEVVLAHHHFSNGRALMDATYRKPDRQEDRKTYENWRQKWLSTPKSS